MDWPILSNARHLLSPKDAYRSNVLPLCQGVECNSACFRSFPRSPAASSSTFISAAIQLANQTGRAILRSPPPLREAMATGDLHLLLFSFVRGGLAQWTLLGMCDPIKGICCFSGQSKAETGATGDVSLQPTHLQGDLADHDPP